MRRGRTQPTSPLSGNIQLLEAAIARRTPIRQADTDGLRICDGEGDRLPGIWIDDLAGHWLAQTTAQPAPEWLLEFPGFNTLHWQWLDPQSKNVPQQIAGPTIESRFEIRERGLRFWIDLNSGPSTGLFLDQIDNRAELRALSKPGTRILNCFAYTCAFSVAAASAGAETWSIDLSPRALAWGRDNFLLNSLDPAEHRFLEGDTLEHMHRLARRGEHFDIIIFDPPTFSRGRHGGTFRVERDYPTLVRAAAIDLLAPGGRILCCTNQRTLSPPRFVQMLLSGLEAPQRWQLSQRPMPPDFPGEPYLKTVWIESRSADSGKDREY